MHGTRISAAAAPLLAVLLLAFGPLAARAHAVDASCVGTVCVAPGPGVAPPAQPDPAPTTTTTAPPSSSADARLTLLADLNRERSAAGLAPFTERSDIDVIAGGWSVHLADAGALSHNADYFTPATRQRLGGWTLGENVAEAPSPDTAHRALMDSPPHRANILDPRFTVVGLGAERRDGSWWVTEDFLQPAEAAHAAGGASEPTHPGLDTSRPGSPAVPEVDGARTSSTPPPPPAAAPATDAALDDLVPAPGLSLGAPTDQTPFPADAAPPVVAGTSHARGLGPAAAVVLAAAGWIALATARRRHARRIHGLVLP